MAKPEFLNQRIENLLKFRVEAAALRPALGDLNFEAVIPYSLGVQSLVSILKDFDFGTLPPGKQKVLGSKMEEFYNALKLMESFDIKIGDATGSRNNIQNEITKKSHELFDALTPVLAVYTALSDDASKQREGEAEIAESLKRIGEFEAKAQSSLKAIEEAAGQAGVSKEAEHFATEADEHKGAALWWLLATIAFVAATAAWGVIALWWLTLDKDAAPAQIVQNIAGKLIILSGLYYGLVWCSRNYRASRHNYVVNRHRQTALSTFEAFVHAAGKDEATKNAVLLQATTSIFSAQPSGYLQTEPDSDQPSKIIEITRSLADSRK